MAINQLAKTSPGIGALAVMASRFNVEPGKLLNTLKATVFKEARNDEEMMALCIVSNEYGLNPLIKEIYAFPAKGGGIVPVVSIDGWIRIINSHPQMDGLDFEMKEDDKGDPISCTAIIYRKDRTRPIRITEYLNECQRNTDPWKMKHRMLRHKSLIQCARVAFGFGGILDEDDAREIKAVEGKVIEKPIFAAPAGAAALPSPVSETEEKVKREAPPKPEAAKAKSKCKPREALENLMEASYISEKGLLTYLAEQSGEEYEAITALDEQLITHLINSWDGIVSHIAGGSQ